MSLHPRGRAALLPAFVSAIFTGAFLLFLVQPMFGRMVLPLLGGSPAVWNTCMVFFQAALLGGYLYADVTTRRLDVRRQAALHLGLLVVAGVLLPVSVAGAAPPGGGPPIPWLLLLMLGSVGPPFLVLAGTGPILQRWFSRSGHPAAADPYWLYAASNLGSMLGLLGYPLLLEPRLRLAGQSALWTAGYALLVLLVAGCAALVWRAAPAPEAVPAEAAAAPLSWRERAVWVGLAFVPSSLLLGVTTYITTDLTPAPMLWVLPLSLYLLSFTLVFARRTLIPHAAMVFFQPSVLAVVALPLVTGFVRSPFFAVPLHLAALFVTAMVCHGELARRRPAVRHLTAFYLWISVGGALGGVFNALLAPVLFPRVWEYPLMLVLACLARPWPRGRVPWRVHAWAAARALGFALALFYLLRLSLRPAFPIWVYVIMVGALLWLLSAGLARAPLWLALCLGSLVLMRTVTQIRREDALFADRSFFGYYRVLSIPENGVIHALYHGSTLHGAQRWERDPEQRNEPMTYYLRAGPLGQLVSAKALANPTRQRRVAAVGLGAGTVAAYATEGEPWDFYEIDPGIERIARNPRLFTYLTDSRGRIRVVRGDARLSLARARETYDLILLDAFSSDAIPTHLLTREAVATYLERLAPDGLIAFRVSNRFLDLKPVVAAVARSHGLVARVAGGPLVRNSRYENHSSWVVLARREEDLGPLAADARWRPPRVRANVPVWTDDYSSILPVFNW
ncbi:MAG TPA: fused MFS/spermidine synthase [Longimicrobiaceae bacterium]|nr:fused MFS/spermidine synthase [Longimicrobiaceae bacterium]